MPQLQEHDSQVKKTKSKY